MGFYQTVLRSVVSFFDSMW